MQPTKGQPPDFSQKQPDYSQRKKGGISSLEGAAKNYRKDATQANQESQASQVKRVGTASGNPSANKVTNTSSSAIGTPGADKKTWNEQFQNFVDGIIKDLKSFVSDFNKAMDSFFKTTSKDIQQGAAAKPEQETTQKSFRENAAELHQALKDKSTEKQNLKKETKKAVDDVKDEIVKTGKKGLFNIKKHF